MATAASTALPPFFKTSTPTFEARCWAVATMPCSAATGASDAARAVKARTRRKIAPVARAEWSEVFMALFSAGCGRTRTLLHLERPMATSPLDPSNNEVRNDRVLHRGHGTRALGPSDSSDSGSDTVGAAGGLDDSELDSDSDRSGTGERASA